MPFDFSDLSDQETALLALEYVRSNGRWFEQAAEETQYGDEVIGILREVAAAYRTFGRDLETRIEEHFGELGTLAEGTIRGLKRPHWLVVAESPETTKRDALDVATAEQEEHYQFFMREAAELEDPWMRHLFQELARHARTVLVYLEEEREGVLDNEG